MNKGETEVRGIRVLAGAEWEPIELLSLTLEGGYARTDGSNSHTISWNEVKETLLMFDENEPRSCIVIEVNWGVSEVLSFSVKDTIDNRESWHHYAAKHLGSTGYGPQDRRLT